MQALQTPTADQTIRETPPVQPHNRPAPPRHHLRTFVAAIFGILATNLIILTALVIWLDRTVTNTDSYVATVAPLVKDPAVQTFIIARTTDGLIASTPTPELVAKLPLLERITGKSTEQLQGQLRTITETNVRSVVTSDKIETIWTDTNRSVHASLMQQLNTNASTIQLDFGPMITGVLNELKTTQIGGLADQVVVPPDVGVITAGGDTVTKLTDYYHWLQWGVWLLIGLTIVCAVLCITLSVAHARTARRVLIGSGISAILLALFLRLPSLVQLPGLSAIDRQALLAFVAVLLHQLTTILLVVGFSCIGLALISKLTSIVMHKRQRLPPQGPTGVDL